MNSKYPDWAYPSLRAFKSEKRQGVKKAIRVLEGDAMLGMAWSPAHNEFHKALELLRDAERKQSIKEWGR